MMLENAVKMIRSLHKKLKFGLLSLVILSGLSACMPPPAPPEDLSNVCYIFKKYPRWYRAAKDVERRWKVPVPVQMAIIHQESKFDGYARPPRTKLLGFIPWTRPTTAYGYSQALNGTWDLYRKTEGNIFSSRTNFSDAVDFIGWYANMAYRLARIPRNDPTALYLAYHEGIGGYQRKTYKHKAWLMPVVRKVANRAGMYRRQLAYCHPY